MVRHISSVVDAFNGDSIERQTTIVLNSASVDSAMRHIVSVVDAFFGDSIDRQTTIVLNSALYIPLSEGRATALPLLRRLHCIQMRNFQSAVPVFLWVWAKFVLISFHSEHTHGQCGPVQGVVFVTETMRHNQVISMASGWTFRMEG